MSELVIVVIALLAISVAIYTIVTLYNKRVAAMAGPRRWIIEEHTVRLSDGPVGQRIMAGVKVELVRGREEPILIGIARCSDPDFEEQLLDLRVRAEDRQGVLNRGLPPVR